MPDRPSRGVRSTYRLKADIDVTDVVGPWILSHVEDAATAERVEQLRTQLQIPLKVERLYRPMTAITELDGREVWIGPDFVEVEGSYTRDTFRSYNSLGIDHSKYANFGSLAYQLLRIMRMHVDGLEAAVQTIARETARREHAAKVARDNDVIRRVEGRLARQRARPNDTPTDSAMPGGHHDERALNMATMAVRFALGVTYDQARAIVVEAMAIVSDVQGGDHDR